MGNIICYNDPCPMCNRMHDTYPEKCLDEIHDAVINAQIECLDDEQLVKLEILYENMRSYSTFWSINIDSKRGLK